MVALLRGEGLAVWRPIAFMVLTCSGQGDGRTWSDLSPVDVSDITTLWASMLSKMET